jgi:hypothetical protein
VAASRVEVAQAITPDLEAYRHCFAGRALAGGRSDYAAAMRELGEAVRLDPAFAMAWYELAYLGEQPGRDPGGARRRGRGAWRRSSWTPTPGSTRSRSSSPWPATRGAPRWPLRGERGQATARQATSAAAPP